MARVTVCKIEDVPADKAFCTRLPDGLRVAVAALKGAATGFVAFEHRCPHANGPIGEGAVKAGQIVCPWHFFRFDLATGKAAGVAQESVMQLRMFPITVERGEISIEV
jgi:nitrite reductase/ring-hydroxylating ferredoxin subunit